MRDLRIIFFIDKIKKINDSWAMGDFFDEVNGKNKLKDVYFIF